MWYFSIHAKHFFDQSSPFIILLGWPFYTKFEKSAEAISLEECLPKHQSSIN